MFFVADVHTHDKKITPTPPTKTLNVKFDKKIYLECLLSETIDDKFSHSTKF